MQISITKLQNKVHAGDWHDAPLKWEVSGPANERQLFSTKKSAEVYARCRRKAKDFAEASKLFARTY